MTIVYTAEGKNGRRAVTLSVDYSAPLRLYRLETTLNARGSRTRFATLLDVRDVIAKETANVFEDYKITLKPTRDEIVA